MKIGWILLGVGVAGGVVYLATRPKTASATPILTPDPMPDPTAAATYSGNTVPATAANLAAETIAVANMTVANGAPLTPDQIKALAAQTSPTSPPVAVLADALAKAIALANINSTVGTAYFSLAKANGASSAQLAQLASASPNYH